MPNPEGGRSGRGRSDDERFERSVAAHQARLRRYRRIKERGVWFAFGMFGAVGWSIVIPVLAGTFLGVWLDGRSGGGVRWTLGLMALGIIFGAVNAWNWIERSRSEGIQEEFGSGTAEAEARDETGEERP